MAEITVYRADLAGGLTPLDVTAATLDEATLKTGHGVYGVFRLYRPADGSAEPRVFGLDRHLDRMRNSARLLGYDFPWGNEDLRAVLREALAVSGVGLARIRLTVPYDALATAVITLEPYQPIPASLYENGVAVGLVDAARSTAHAKDTRFIEERVSLTNKEMYETILVGPDGAVLEGTTSNVYFVLVGTFRTAGDGVLEGVARRLLLQAASRVLPVETTAIQRDDLPSISEAMLTSSSRGVIPIVSIAGQPVGAGMPGPVYHELRTAYDALVEQALRPL